MIKRVELDMIGFDVGDDPVKQGQMALRWRKMTIVDGVVVTMEYSRTMIDVDSDLDATLNAVSDDLERQGYGRPPDTDRGYIEDAATRAWTPEVRAAVAADRAERAAREKAEREAREAELEAIRIAEAEAAEKREAEQKIADEARYLEWAHRAGLIKPDA